MAFGLKTGKNALSRRHASVAGGSFMEVFMSSPKSLLPKFQRCGSEIFEIYTKSLKPLKALPQDRFFAPSGPSPGLLNKWRCTGIVPPKDDERFLLTTIVRRVLQKPSGRGFCSIRQDRLSADIGLQENLVMPGSTGKVETGTHFELPNQVTSKVENGTHFDLPIFENATLKLVNKVIGIIDDQEWGPEVIEQLTDLNVVLTSFLVQQIGSKLSGDLEKKWSFFQWARGKVTRPLGIRTHVWILTALGEGSRIDLMRLAFDLVLEDGHRVNPWPYNVALKWSARADIDGAQYFLDLMKVNHCIPTVATYNILIEMYANQGHHNEALDTFKKMLEVDCPPNIGTYNALIYAYGVAQQPEVASSLFKKLYELGCKPNYTTYKTLINIHSEAGNPEMAQEYLNIMKEAGLEAGTDIYEILRTVLPKRRVAGAFLPEIKAASPGTEETGNNQPADVKHSESGLPSTRALQLLASSGESVNSGAVDTWNKTFADLSAPEINPNLRGRIVSPKALAEMLQCVSPDLVRAELDKIKPIVYPRYVNIVLQRLTSTESALVFFNWVKLQPYYKHNEHTYTCMVSVYGRSRNYDGVAKILQEMQENGFTMSTPVFTSLITTYGLAKSLDGALMLFDMMKEWGCKPDVVTYTSLIHVLTKHGRYETALQKYEEMLEAKIEPNVQTYSVLIYNFVKTNRITAAVALLKDMPKFGCSPNAITFTSIINHCARGGDIDLAIDLYNQMVQLGVRPLRSTISLLELACKKAGKDDEAKIIVEKFQQRRIWDFTYRSATRKVAQELLSIDSTEHVNKVLEGK